MLLITAVEKSYNYDPKTGEETISATKVTTKHRWSTNGDRVMVDGEMCDIEGKGKTATLYPTDDENKPISYKIILKKLK